MASCVFWSLAQIRSHAETIIPRNSRAYVLMCRWRRSGLKMRRHKLSQNDHFVSKYPNSVAIILKLRFRDQSWHQFSSWPRFRPRARNPVGPRPGHEQVQDWRDLKCCNLLANDCSPQPTWKIYATTYCPTFRLCLQIFCKWWYFWEIEFWFGVKKLNESAYIGFLQSNPEKFRILFTRNTNNMLFLFTWHVTYPAIVTNRRC